MKITIRRAITIWIAVFAAIAGLAIATQGQGLPLLGKCIDSVTLRSYTTINVSGTDIEIEVDNVPCPYGCVVNASQYGDDCADRPINNVGFNMAIWVIGVIFAIGAWRQKYWWGPWTGSILMLALSLWFAWYVSMGIGLIPFAISVMMLFQSITLSTKKR